VKNALFFKKMALGIRLKTANGNLNAGASKRVLNCVLIKKITETKDHLINSIKTNRGPFNGTEDENYALSFAQYHKWIVYQYFGGDKSNEIVNSNLNSEMLKFLSSDMDTFCYTVVDELLLNQNGKNDQLSLSNLVQSEGADREESVPLRSDTWEKPVYIEKGVLCEDEIGVTNHFYKLGINSTSAIVLTDELSKEIESVSINVKNVIMSYLVEGVA